jgi:hypothetical protein
MEFVVDSQLIAFVILMVTVIVDHWLLHKEMRKIKRRLNDPDVVLSSSEAAFYRDLMNRVKRLEHKCYNCGH